MAKPFRLHTRRRAMRVRGLQYLREGHRRPPLPRRAGESRRPHDRGHADARRRPATLRHHRDRRVRSFRAARLEDDRRGALQAGGRAHPRAYRTQFRRHGRDVATLRQGEAAQRHAGADIASAAARRDDPPAVTRPPGGARLRAHGAVRGGRQPPAIRHEPDGRGSLARYAWTARATSQPSRRRRGPPLPGPKAIAADRLRAAWSNPKR